SLSHFPVFFFQAEDGIRDLIVTGFRRVLFRSEGQGAELLWRDARDKSLSALDALKIYALKTAPAFEAALYSGLRLAGPTDAYDRSEERRVGKEGRGRWAAGGDAGRWPEVCSTE